MVDIYTTHPQSEFFHRAFDPIGIWLDAKTIIRIFLQQLHSTILEDLRAAINHEMDGSVVIITGASSSLGLETVNKH